MLIRAEVVAVRARIGNVDLQRDLDGAAGADRAQRKRLIGGGTEPVGDPRGEAEDALLGGRAGDTAVVGEAEARGQGAPDQRPGVGSAPADRFEARRVRHGSGRVRQRLGRDHQRRRLIGEQQVENTPDEAGGSVSDEQDVLAGHLRGERDDEHVAAAHGVVGTDGEVAEQSAVDIDRQLVRVVDVVAGGVESELLDAAGEGRVESKQVLVGAVSVAEGSRLGNVHRQSDRGAEDEQGQILGRLFAGAVGDLGGE